MLDALKDVIRKSSIHVCLINTGGCNGCDIENLVNITVARNINA